MTAFDKEMNEEGSSSFDTVTNERTHLLRSATTVAASESQPQLHTETISSQQQEQQQILLQQQNAKIRRRVIGKSSPSWNRRLPARRRNLHWLHYVAQYSVAFMVSCLVVMVEYQPPTDSDSFYYKVGGRSMRLEKFHNFPSDFVWGAATSAFQIEGGREERGATIWDTFASDELNILDGSNGDVACDHYDKMQQDVDLMKSLGLQAYRFSIAWTRILPTGRPVSGKHHDVNEVNQKGIDFYNRLIDALLEAGITPYVTLFHWDLPQTLEDEYGGWLDRRIINDFQNYAEVCFHHFGDRVLHWITLNESWTVAVNGYNNHVHAPGHYKHPGTETYLAAHHLLLAHAKTVQLYRRKYRNVYDDDDDDSNRFDDDDATAKKPAGMIGMSNCADFRYPLDKTNMADREAAERAMVFQLAWFADPIYFGDYPAEMKQRLGHRLPRFTRDERRMLKGSSDFFGLNHYSSLLAAEPAEQTPTYEGYWADMHVDFSAKDKWKRNDMGWSIVPHGCRELLKWIANRYDNPILIMTENGSAEPEPNLETALHDEGRRSYFESYLRASAEAMETDSVDMRGYFAWSLMDNFEWQFGYQRRFGICRVDFETQERTPKSSALWYAQTIAANGHNIRRKEFSYFE